MRYFALAACLVAGGETPAYAFLGTEMAPLIQLVTGQISQIKKLSETLGVAKDQAKLLETLNDGIGKTVSQIQSIQSIVERAQGLDPAGLKSLSDINELLARATETQAEIEEMISTKVVLANQAITQGALQSDTTYKMGQEMVATGSRLTRESQQASPGRAAQISAASSSAQMLGQGVQLQTMAQMVQLQAMSLEFQKDQVEREARNSKVRRTLFQNQLSAYRKRPKS